jgi:hypothetical protein
MPLIGLIDAAEIVAANMRSAPTAEDRQWPGRVRLYSELPKPNRIGAFGSW